MDFKLVTCIALSAMKAKLRPLKRSHMPERVSKFKKTITQVCFERFQVSAWIVQKSVWFNDNCHMALKTPLLHMYILIRPEDAPIDRTVVKPNFIHRENIYIPAPIASFLLWNIHPRPHHAHTTYFTQKFLPDIVPLWLSRVIRPECYPWN